MEDYDHGPGLSAPGGTLNRKPSRSFSSRVFNKLGGAGSKPPQPPPKDRFYLSGANAASSVSLSARSFTSPSINDQPVPAVPSLPLTLPVPTSPQQQHLQQYSGYNSAHSLSPSSSHITMPNAPSSASSETGSFKKGFFNKFGSSMKRKGNSKSPKIPQPEPAQSPPDTDDDGSISFPWNFEVSLIR